VLNYDTRLNDFTVLAFYHLAFKSQHRHWWPELFQFLKHPCLHLCKTEFFSPFVYKVAFNRTKGACLADRC